MIRLVVFKFKTWIFEVDRSNNASVLISLHGLNATVNGVQWVGPQFNFSLGQISDDSWGVGSDEARCSWNNASWFSVILGDHVSPSIQSGEVGNETIYCQNIDRLGNLGPISTFNVYIDAVLPEITLLPSSGEIILHIPPCHLRFQIICSTVHIDLFALQNTGYSSQYHNISVQTSHRNFPLRTSSRTSTTVQSQLSFTPRITSGISINPRHLVDIEHHHALNYGIT